MIYKLCSLSRDKYILAIVKVPYQGPDEDVTLVICGSITSPSSCFQPLIYGFLRLCILSTQNEWRGANEKSASRMVYLHLLACHGVNQDTEPWFVGAGLPLLSITLTKVSLDREDSAHWDTWFFELVKWGWLGRLGLLVFSFIVYKYLDVPADTFCGFREFSWVCRWTSCSRLYLLTFVPLPWLYHR